MDTEPVETTDSEWDHENDNVQVPALVMHLMESNQRALSHTQDQLAIAAWDDVERVTREALALYDAVDKAANIVTTRPLEYALNRAPAAIWANTNRQAREMIVRLGGEVHAPELWADEYQDAESKWGEW